MDPEKDQSPIPVTDNTSIPENESLPPAPLESPKKSKKPLIIILSVVLILLIAAAVVYYLLFINTPTTTPKTTQTETSKKITASALVEQIKSGITGTLTKPDNIDDGRGAPDYKPSGYDFSVSPTAGAGLTSTSTKADTTTDLKLIEDSLVAQKMTKVVHQALVDDAQYDATYTSDSLVCNISYTTPYQPKVDDARYSTTLTCANIADYSANAKELQPYFVAWVPLPAGTKDNAYLHFDSTSDSKTAGYKLTTIGVGSSLYGAFGGYAGLFYTSPDGVLHYFIGTQNELSCSEYNTVELKKAYLGEACYDQTTSKDSSVTL